MKRSVLLLVAVSACASGFDRGALKQRLAGEPIEVTDSDIQRVLSLTPQLRFPFKLGILFLEDDAPSSRYVHDRPQWKWDQEDREAVLRSIEPFKTRGIVSDAFVVSSPSTPGT
jgi:hypothetical protein